MKKKYLTGLAVIMVLTFIYGFTAKTTKQVNNEPLNGENRVLRVRHCLPLRSLPNQSLPILCKCHN